MRSMQAALVGVATAFGAAAMPIDMENHARWVVLDHVAATAPAAARAAEVRDLRSFNHQVRSGDILAVCGTLDFNNADEGHAAFLVLFREAVGSRPALVSAPFFYDPVAAVSLDPELRVAQAACSGGDMHALTPDLVR